MDTQMLTNFFMWCTILNGCLLVLWTLIWFIAPDLVFRIQSKWFPLSREAFDTVFYGFLGLFKIFFLMFNVVPYVSLIIVG